MRNQYGFTLIEIILVMVILSVLTSIFILRFEQLSSSAAQQALKSGIIELNVRETLIWSKIRLSKNGWTDDARVYMDLDTYLGRDYLWNPGPTRDGGTLHYKSHTALLTRKPSTLSEAGKWD